MSIITAADPRIVQLNELLAGSKRVAIVGHYNPDGDAIGSTLGLALVLKAAGHTVQVVMPNPAGAFLSRLAGYSEIVCFTERPAAAIEVIKKCDVLFCLDFNRSNRTGGLEEVVGAAEVRVLIDHHQDPEQFTPVMFSDTSACSTCQMVFDIVTAMGLSDLITQDVATSLYTGLVTDTGSFRFRSTTAHTMKVGAALIEKGVDIEAVHSSISDDNTEDRLRLLGFTLSERMQVLPEYSTVIISLAKEDLKRFNFKQGDTEGFVNYGLSIRGIRLAAFFVERPDMVKISLRSKSNLFVDKFLGENFSGGGHRNAAGGQDEGPLQSTVDRFISLLPGLISEFPA
ncbi:MAG: bifunctional oligoribonuclease/PAP phosphatase NrnA [Flavobacteriales bacterium]|nr:bifunctional oligoribonuclease/PAP phosphatase NrnA [Flavobacteriales bacterium]